MSFEAGSQVEIIVTNPCTSVEMTSMVEDCFTVAWCCVRELCSVWYLLSMVATAAGTATHLFPLGRLSSNNHGLVGAWGTKWLQYKEPAGGAWHCASCAGREGQHCPAFASLAGRMGLEVRQECGSGHNLF